MLHHDKLLELFHSSDERNVAIAMEMAKNPEYAFLQAKIDDYLVLCQALYDKNVNVLEPGQVVRLNGSTMALSKQKIERLPVQVHHLKHIETLYLEECQINDLSAIGAFTNLNWLEITDCELTKLPPEIGKLKNLTYLKLSDTRLKCLPKSIGQLENLGTLDLTGCNLKKLPNTIVDLKNLGVLNLRYNRLRRLPKRIGQLENLGVLILEHNKIRRLPKSFQRLQLSQLHILTTRINYRQITKYKALHPKCRVDDELVDVF